MTTVRNCDVVEFPADGQVIDIGSYEKLLARNFDFRQLTLTEADVPGNGDAGSEALP